MATQNVWIVRESRVYAANQRHAEEVVTAVVAARFPTATLDRFSARKTSDNRYTVSARITVVIGEHTVRGVTAGPEGWAYGVTHDFDCPGCAGTSYTASPRSESYWSS